MIAGHMARFGRFLPLLRNYVANSKHYKESDFPFVFQAF
jgi:hypothetical protein